MCIRDSSIGKTLTTTCVQERFDFSDWHTIQSDNQMMFRSPRGNIHLSTNNTVHCDTPVVKVQGDVIGGGGKVSLITHLHGQPVTGADATVQGDTKKPIGGTGQGS